MRDDGYLIFDSHQVDFDTEAEAIMAIRGEARRNKMGPCQVLIHYRDFQAAGRRHLSKTIDMEYCTKCGDDIAESDCQRCLDS